MDTVCFAFLLIVISSQFRGCEIGSQGCLRFLFLSGCGCCCCLRKCCSGQLPWQKHHVDWRKKRGFVVQTPKYDFFYLQPHAYFMHRPAPLPRRTRSKESSDSSKFRRDGESDVTPVWSSKCAACDTLWNAWQAQGFVGVAKTWQACRCLKWERNFVWLAQGTRECFWTSHIN